MRILPLRAPHPTRILAGAWLLGFSLLSQALAHPGSGIAIDRLGRIFFVDTGAGVWVVETDGSLHALEGPAFHWMTLDPASRFGATAFTHLPSSDMRAIGRDPMVLLSSDFPIAVGAEGALYFPEPGKERRLHLVRLEPSGARSDLAVLPAESEGRKLDWLNGIASGSNGVLYYTENDAVRRVDRQGDVTTVARAISVPDCDALPGVPADFMPYLRGLAVADDGTVYVAANGCRAVLRIAADGTIAVALRAEAPWSPTGVALHTGDAYVLEYLHDQGDDRKAWVPRVRKLTPDGTATLVVAIDRAATRREQRSP